MQPDRTTSHVHAARLPATGHELLLHLSVGGDRWWRASNSSCGGVNYGDGIAGPLGQWLVKFSLRRVLLETGRCV
jgi:hypothetical protein